MNDTPTIDKEQKKAQEQENPKLDYPIPTL